jgi:hypothetical protein
MLPSAARYIFDKNIVDKRDPAWVFLTTSLDSHAEKKP